MPTPASDSAPSLLARLLAFAAIVIAGVCGGLIGYAVTDLQCTDECTTLAAGVALASAIGAAIGVAIVAVLSLRAMAEWSSSQARVEGTTDRHP